MDTHAPLSGPHAAALWQVAKELGLTSADRLDLVGAQRDRSVESQHFTQSKTNK